MTTTTTAELPQEAAPTRTRAWPARIAARFGRDLLYLTLGLVTSVIAFTVVVTGLTVSISLAIFIVGLWAAIGTVYVFRWSAGIDRRLAKFELGERIEARYRTVPAGTGWLRRLGILLGDWQTWRDLAWLVLHSVIGFSFGVATLTIVGSALGAISIPAWWTFLPDDAQVAWYDLDSWGAAWMTAGLGVALLAVSVPVLRLMALGESRLAWLLLKPSKKERLEDRVEQLATTRAGAVAGAQADLERIERDLHDGAQARLVALAMELGMAEERAIADPEAAREMVIRARGEALTALAELRDLARGMRPALLAERGLRAAIEALAARSPLQTSTSFEGDLDGLPQQTETAAYFIVAETLTNATKHGDAGEVRISLRRADGLTVEVVDDGRGGADPDGAGLTGLRRRVEALDGRLEITSPVGGPTVVRAELPEAAMG